MCIRDSCMVMERYNVYSDLHNNLKILQKFIPPTQPNEDVFTEVNLNLLFLIEIYVITWNVVCKQWNKIIEQKRIHYNYDTSFNTYRYLYTTVLQVVLTSITNTKYIIYSIIINNTSYHLQISQLSAYTKMLPTHASNCASHNY